MNWFGFVRKLDKTKQDTLVLVFEPVMKLLNAEMKHPFLCVFRNLDEFSKLLLGPEMSNIIDEVVRRRRRHEQSELTYELSHCQLKNTRLKDVLKTAKRAFSISDPSGSLFENLSGEITSQHSILQTLVDRVLKDKEVCSSDEREVTFFPHASILPALFAHGLFPGLFERGHIEDYF